MKLFKLPRGLSVWNTPDAAGDTRFLYREMFERRCYERNGIAVHDGDVVFDVGANVGMFGLSLMERHGGLQLYSFEPVPGTFACLQRNLTESSHYAAHTVEAFNCALGEADGETTIEFFPGAPSNSTLCSADKHRDFGRLLEGVRFSDMWRTGKLRALAMLPLFPFRKRLLGPAFDRLMAQGVSVPCRVGTLSGIIRERGVSRIDLLKIDVEGAEMSVLAGLEQAHWNLVRQLAMEIEPANKPLLPSFVDRLHSLGFTHVVVENMFGGPCDQQDAVACTVFAHR
ncbi:MAG: FkbM family methyltransferase [Candidatus Solibacter sp.]